MTEKSGIELLEEVLKRLDIIEKKLSVIDQNVKTLINTTRIADLVTNAANTPLENWTKSIPKVSAKEKIEKLRAETDRGFKNFSFEATDASKIKSAVVVDKSGRSASVMVKGRIMAQAGEKPVLLSNISVKIYDNKDKMVKETRTNRAGQWMSQLPPGKYVALFEGEIDGKRLVPQNRMFEVPEELPSGQTFIEVV